MQSDVHTLSENGEASTTRRNFFVVAIYGMMGAIGAALGVPALIYLFLPPKAQQGSEWVKVGDISQLAPNEPAEISYHRNRVDGWKVISEKSTVWVVKSADNAITAFGPQCTHLGCAYHWDDNKDQFLCPCHNSLFSVDGKVMAGPAPRPLDRFQTKVEGGVLMIGKLERLPEARS